MATTAALIEVAKASQDVKKPEPEPEPKPEPEKEPEPTEVEVEAEKDSAEASETKNAETDDSDSDEPESAEPETKEEPEPEPDPDSALYRSGDNGPAVLALQKQLSSTGYWLGTPDGGYGHLTQQAVYALQKAHGLVRDGIAGPNVRAAAAKNFRPSAVGGGNLMEIHLQQQIILVVRGGSTKMVLNTSTASGERYEFQGQWYTARTRTGDFNVRYIDGTGWREGELGKMWRPQFYSGNYAIHGSPDIPPYPASHGCSRVSTAAMDMIWRDGLMSMGSRVLVV